MTLTKQPMRSLAAAVIISAITACSGQETADPQPVTRTFTCTFASSEDSKVAISETGKSTWEVNDRILVHGGNRKVVTLTAGDISADGKKATISVEGITPYDRSGDRGYISTIYATYPADAVVDGNLYYYSRFNDTNHPLMAAYNDGDNLVFYNLCGVISFRVTGDIDSYVFSGKNGETVGYSHFQTYLVLQGDHTPRLDWSYGSDPGTSGPLAEISGPVTADGTTLNYICFPNGANFSGGFTITFKKGSTAVATASVSSALNLQRNHMIALGDITSHLHAIDAGTLCQEAYLGQRPMVIAYMTEYTEVATMDATYLTHINYAHGRFGNPSTGDGGIVISKPERLAAALQLKDSKPTLKVLLMIGGWGEKADGFSMMARDANKRTAFCQACKAHIDTYGLDGIDIDWEYPGGGPASNGKSDQDAANFNLVLQELRATIGNTKIISVASSSSAGYIDWDEAIKYVDYVNVMTYDMGKPPKHNSPLYRSATFNQTSCQESIAAHHSASIPYNRLVLGVPFYGHGISPYDSDVKYVSMAGILADTSGPYAGYNIRQWDDVAKVPYLTDSNGTIYLGYDDAESVAWKGKFVHDNNLLGAMFWEYRHDDASGTLRQALYNAVYPE